MDTQNNSNNINYMLQYKSDSIRVSELGLQKTINIINHLASSTKRSLNAKVKIDTGKFCNARCNFCYYLDRVKERDFLTMDEVLESRFVEHLLERGIRSFEFSGGEPTLCWDLGEIITYIRYIAEQSYGINPNTLKFSIVTNGYNLREKYTSWKEKDHGKVTVVGPEYAHVSEILFSLHGHRELHTSITKIKDSYDRIVNFVEEWLDSKDIEPEDGKPYPLYTYVKLIRVNVVVGPDTFNMTEQSIAFQSLLIEWMQKGIQVNLLPQNTWDRGGDISGDSNDIHEFFSRITRSVNYFLDMINVFFPLVFNYNSRYRKAYGANIFNIRYFSHCLIKPQLRKYDQFIVNHFDHLFDQLDWNKVLYPEERNGANGIKYKNYYSPLYISCATAAKAFFKDANQSHYVDSICKKCPKFLELKCDGQKYTNQNVELNGQPIKQINYETTEQRTLYVK